MTLNARPNYPGSRCHMLKIRRDASPGLGQIFGRLEHVESGASVEFLWGDALRRAITDQLDRVKARHWPGWTSPGGEDPPDGPIDPTVRGRLEVLRGPVRSHLGKRNLSQSAWQVWGRSLAVSKGSRRKAVVSASAGL